MRAELYNSKVASFSTKQASRMSLKGILRGREVEILGSMNKKSILQVTVSSDLLPHLTALLDTRIDRIIVGYGFNRSNLDKAFSSLEDFKRSSAIRDISALCFGDAEQFLPDLDKAFEQATSKDISVPQAIKLLTRCAQRCKADSNGKGIRVAEQLLSYIEANLVAFVGYAVLGADIEECSEKAKQACGDYERRFNYFDREEVEVKYFEKLAQGIMQRAGMKEERSWQGLFDRMAGCYERGEPIEKIKESAHKQAAFILERRAAGEVADLFIALGNHELNSKLLDALSRLVILEAELLSGRRPDGMDRLDEPVVKALEEDRATEETAEILEAFIKSYPDKVEYRLFLAEFYKTAKATELSIEKLEETLKNMEEGKMIAVDPENLAVYSMLIMKVREARQAHNNRIDEERKERLGVLDKAAKKGLRKWWGLLKRGDLTQKKFGEVIEKEPLFFDLAIDQVVSRIRGGDTRESWGTLLNLEGLVKDEGQKEKITELKKGVINKILYRALTGAIMNTREKELALKQAEKVGIIDHFMLMQIESLELHLKLRKDARHNQINFLREIYEKAFDQYLKQARELAGENKFEEALLMLEKARKAHPRSSSVDLTAANIYATQGAQLFEAGNFKEAIPYYDKALKYYPEHMVAKQHKYASTVRLAEELVEKGEEMPAVAIFLELSELIQKEIISKLDQDTQNPALRELLHVGYGNLAYCLRRIYELVEKEEALDRAIEAVQLSAGYSIEGLTDNQYFNLTQLYAYKEDWKAMIAAAEQYVEMSDEFEGNLALLYMIPMLLYQNFIPCPKGFRGLIETILEKNIFPSEMVREKSEHLSQIAGLFISLGELDLARSIAERLMDRQYEGQITYALGLLVKTRALLFMGKNEEALDQVLDALNLAQSYKETFYSEQIDREVSLSVHGILLLGQILGNWAMKGGFIQDGLVMLEEYVEKIRSAAPQGAQEGQIESSEYAAVCHTLGIIKDFLGKKDEAQELLLTSVKHRPDYLIPYLHLINIHRTSGNKEKLISTIKAMTEIMESMLDSDKEGVFPIFFNLSLYISLIKLYAETREAAVLGSLKKMKQRSPKAIGSAVAYLEAQNEIIPKKIKSL